MGMVHAAQKGELRHPSGKVAELAARMKYSDALDFARTKHTKPDGHKLPNRVKREGLTFREFLEAKGWFDAPHLP